jgi:hypothetical protein
MHIGPEVLALFTYSKLILALFVAPNFILGMVRFATALPAHGITFQYTIMHECNEALMTRIAHQLLECACMQLRIAGSDSQQRAPLCKPRHTFFPNVGIEKPCMYMYVCNTYVCMYVCMYVSMYVCIYTYVYRHTHTQTHTHTHTQTHT